MADPHSGLSWIYLVVNLCLYYGNFDQETFCSPELVDTLDYSRNADPYGVAQPAHWRCVILGKSQVRYMVHAALCGAISYRPIHCVVSDRPDPSNPR